MTQVVTPTVPEFDYLPGLCNASGCLSDPAPGQRYCWRHLKSRNEKAREISERQKRAQARRVERVAPLLKVHLYVVEIELSDYVKFGVSQNPQKRLAGLQTASPLPLRMIAHVGCDRNLERFVHAYCEQHRIKGEWFRREGRAAEVERLIIAGDPLAIYALIGRKPPWSLS